MSYFAQQKKRKKDELIAPVQTTSHGAAQLLGLLSQPSRTNPAQTLVLVVAEGSLTARILFSVQQTLIPLNLHTQFSFERSCQYG